MVRWVVDAASWMAVIAAMSLATGSHGQQPPSVAPGTLDCRMLAGMPNAPMSVQTCEARMAVHRDMMSALETPGGERSGDDRMTCEVIVAEMKTLKVTGVSAANASEGEVAGRNALAIMQRAQAEGLGMMGAQTARSAAAAVVPGNAAGHAAAAANLAEQKAMQDRIAAQMGPARDRVDAANTNSLNDLVKAMRANPRFARLVKLGGERNCQG
jgi:hypothetical protein